MSKMCVLPKVLYFLFGSGARELCLNGTCRETGAGALCGGAALPGLWAGDEVPKPQG